MGRVNVKTVVDCSTGEVRTEPLDAAEMQGLVDIDARTPAVTTKADLEAILSKRPEEE